MVRAPCSTKASYFSNCRNYETRFFCVVYRQELRNLFFLLLNNNSAFELLENVSVFSVSCVQRLL